jgi:PIN domain nuclease of toxin-antitoxin system
LTLRQDPERLIPEQVAANAFEVLPVQLHHALRIHSLPPLHRDPFDRVLVAQALSEQMVLVSGDPHIAQYPVEVVW